MSQRSTNISRGYTVALLSSLLLSTTAIFIRQLTLVHHLPPVVLATWRDGFVALTLLLTLGIVRRSLLRVSRRSLQYLVLFGFVLAIFNVTWTYSVALNGAAVSTVLVYSSAGFTALLARWLLRERLDVVKMVAVLLSLGGCLLVSGATDLTEWNSNAFGIATGLFSGLCYAIYSLMGRSSAQSGLNPWATVVYTFGAAACLLALFNTALNLLAGTAAGSASLLCLGDDLAGWGILLLLAAGPTVLGFGLYNMSLVYLPSSVANLLLTSEPVFTTVIAYFVFGEVLGGLQVVGSLLILAGVIFLRIHEGRLSKRDTEAPGESA